MATEKMKEIFRINKQKMTKNNFHLKSVAVLIALLLWVFAQEISNPETIATFDTKLTILGEDTLKNKGYVLANASQLKNKKITIKLKDFDKKLIALRESKGNDEEIFSATLDLGGIGLEHEQDAETATPITKYIDYVLPQGFNDTKLISRSDATIDIILDKYITDEEKEIRLEQKGTVAEGYKDLNWLNEITPKTVKISGAKSVVDDISAVKVAVDLNGKSSDISSMVEIKVMGNNGKDLTSELNLNTKMASVTIPIRKVSKLEVIPPTQKYIGNVKEGFTVVNFSYEPEEISVTGSKEELEKIKKITLPQINIDGISETKEETFNLEAYFNSLGLELAILPGSPNDIKIKVEVVGEITKEFEIMSNQLAIKGITKKAEILTESIKLKLTGVEDKINSINISNLKGTVDVSGLNIGTYTLPVVFDEIDGVRQAEKPPEVSIAISENTVVNTNESEVDLETPESENTDTNIEAGS